MAQRIKGQEVAFTMVSDVAGVERSLGLVKSCELSPQFDIITQGYLGETTDRRDDIFKGITGNMEVNIAAREYFAFLGRVKDRAQRRVAGSTKFQLMGSFKFDDGTRVTITIDDVFFGEQQVSVSGRDEFVSCRIAFEADDFRVSNR